MTGAARLTIWRASLALLTAAVLVVGFYFPLVGFGYAVDASATLSSRVTGLLLFLPAVGLLVLLLGMLPVMRSRVLLAIGIGGSLLLLPSLAACVCWLRFWPEMGALAGLLYLWAWWHLARPRLRREEAADG